MPFQGFRQTKRQSILTVGMRPVVRPGDDHGTLKNCLQ